MAYFVLMCH